MKINTAFRDVEKTLDPLARPVPGGRGLGIWHRTAAPMLSGPPVAGPPQDIQAVLAGRRPPPTPPVTGTGLRRTPGGLPKQTRHRGQGEGGSAARPVLYCGQSGGAARPSQHSRGGGAARGGRADANAATAAADREPPGVGARARGGFVQAAGRGQSSSMGLLSS